MNRHDITAADAVIGLSIVNVLSIYRDSCPKLADIRGAPKGDYGTRQALLDADILGGIAVILIGGTSAYMTRDIFPLLLAASGLLLVSLYYRSVAHSPSPAQVEASL